MSALPWRRESNVEYNISLQISHTQWFSKNSTGRFFGEMQCQRSVTIVAQHKTDRSGAGGFAIT